MAALVQTGTTIHGGECSTISTCRTHSTGSTYSSYMTTTTATRKGGEYGMQVLQWKGKSHQKKLKNLMKNPKRSLLNWQRLDLINLLTSKHERKNQLEVKHNIVFEYQTCRWKGKSYADKKSCPSIM